MSDDNAHPFQVGPITLVHNGTITNPSEFRKDHIYNQNVDSEAIAYALADAPPEEVLPKLDGGFSIVWWDSRDASLNFARNDSKPMWWLFSKDHSVLYYGSEYTALWHLCLRNDIEVANKVQFTSPLNHYKFSDSAKLGVFAKIPFRPSEKSTATHQKGATGGMKTTWPTPNLSKEGRTSGGTVVGTINKDTVVDQLTGLEIPQDLVKTLKIGRARQLAELCAGRGVNLKLAVLCKPDQWRPYKKSASSKGTIVCRHVATNCEIHIDSYTHAQWEDMCIKKDIYVRVVNFKKEKIEGRNAYVLVGQYDKHITGVRKQQTPLTVPGRNGVLLDFHAYKDLTACGCAECGNTVMFCDHDKITWLENTGRTSDFLCPKCTKSAKILEHYEGFLPNNFKALIANAT